jgi:hypothetical protein
VQPLIQGEKTMNTQKIRSSLALAILALTLFLSQAAPAAAQEGISATAVPITFHCVKGTVSYPVGSVVRYLLPYPEPVYVWARCELSAPATPGSGLIARWVYYGYNPG